MPSAQLMFIMFTSAVVIILNGMAIIENIMAGNHDDDPGEMQF